MHRLLGKPSRDGDKQKGGSGSDLDAYLVHCYPSYSVFLIYQLSGVYLGDLRYKAKEKNGDGRHCPFHSLNAWIFFLGA